MSKTFTGAEWRAADWDQKKAWISDGWTLEGPKGPTESECPYCYHWHTHVTIRQEKP